MKTMGRVIVAIATVFLFFSLVNAQELPRNERNKGGILINQDYFIARQYREINELLLNVETNHLQQKHIAAVFAGRRDGIADMLYILNKFPNHPKALMLLSIGAQMTKDKSMAIPHFLQAIKLYPQYALTHAQLGNYLVDIGVLQEGIARLKKAVEIDAKLVVGYEWLSKAYTKSGNMEMAKHMSEQAKMFREKGKKPSEIN